MKKKIATWQGPPSKGCKENSGNSAKNVGFKKGKTQKEEEGGSSLETTPGGEIDGRRQVGEQIDDEAPKGAPKPDIRELKRAEAMTKMTTKKHQARLIGLSAGEIQDIFIEEPKGAYVPDHDG